jgi:serine/threonine protein kinase
MTDAANWARVKALFQQALDLSAAEREAFVSRECGEDKELHDEVQSMLAAMVAHTTRLQGDARELLDGPGDAPSLPPNIGPFRPTALIGRGGMGVVYRAQRDVDGGIQVVALKLIAAGFSEPALIRRFERERSILARLQHPNIAHFIDGGMTADGSPWLAMQYIDGQDLLRWCDARRLTPRDRVALFLQVIDAVAFAHRNLIVHRDIKPSNILVDATGHVRLLDFGIAKLLDEVADPALTGTAAAPMTPEYAAPEQILGGNASTATDVHALGVVLFELLCGRLPYVIGSGRHVAAAICEQEPHRLRQALSRREDASSRRNAEPADIARQRAVSVQELRRTFDRDLEQIVATAVARAPDERYGNVEAFGDDLRAWIDDRPLRSRPTGWIGRTRKFVRRHGVGVAVSASLMVVALTGVAATLWQAERAKAQAQRANAARRVLTELFQAADPQAMNGRSLSARELVDQGAARLRGDTSIDNDLRASLLTDLGVVYLSLGELKSARILFDDVAAMSGLTDDTRRRALKEQARVLIADSDYVAAEALADRLDGLLAERPADDPSRIEALLLRAEIDYEQHRIEQVIATIEPLLKHWPGGRERLQLRADARYLLAEARSEQRQYDVGLALLRDALADYQASHARASTLTSTRHEIARALGALNRFDEALPAFQSVLAEHTRVFGADHPLSLSTKGEIADLLKRMNRFDEASRVFEEVIESKRRTLGPDHDDLAVALFNYGSLRYVRDEFKDALPYFEEAATIWARKFGMDGDRSLVARDALASVRAETGDIAAVAEMEDVVRIREAQGDNDALAASLNSYGVVLDRAGRLPESCLQFRRSVAIATKIFPDQPDQARWSRALLGRCLRRSGQWAEAESELRWSRTSFLAQPIEPGPRVAFIDMELARTLRAANGNRSEIASLYEEALRLRRSKLNPEHPKIAESERERAAFGRGEALPEGV